jgi:hypothetical protein
VRALLAPGAGLGGALGALLLLGGAGTVESPEASLLVAAAARVWVAGALLGASALGPIAVVTAVAWTAGAAILALLRRRRRSERWKEVERLERAMFTARSRRRRHPRSPGSASVGGLAAMPRAGPHPASATESRAGPGS